MKIYIISFILFCNALFAQDGSIDSKFNTTLDLNNSIEVIKEQGDGKILIGGTFNSKLERLNNDGSTDITFNGANILSSAVYCIGLQSDHKIVVGGTFNGMIKRLNSNGSIDNSFNCNIAGGALKNIEILNNGKILICGIFYNVNGNAITGIARLNSDGSLDTSFNLNLDAGTGIRDFGIQKNGKIIIAGEATTLISPYISLVFRRYNIDNTLDSTFNTGGSNAEGNIYDIEISTDDKIIISGSFSHFNNQTRTCLARLNSDGTLDAAFNSYNFTEYSIFGVKSLNDGKYIICGSFEKYNGQSSNKIARLNNDGTLDNSFNIGTGANDLIWNTEIQKDGKILIGGDFTLFNNNSKNRIARLGNTILSTKSNTYESSPIIIYPNPTQDLVFLENTNSSLILTPLKLYNSIGQFLKSYKSVDIVSEGVSLKEFSSGIYYLQIMINGKIFTKKIIKK